MELELTARLIPGEPVPYAEAIAGEFRPFRVGDLWGPPWSTTWFHVRGHVPEEWAGRSVVALIDLGWHGPTGFTCEALAWRDGEPWRGLDPNHFALPVDGPNVDFYLEAAANPMATEAGVEPAQSMIELRESTEPAFVLNQAELALWDDPAIVASRLDLGPHVITAVGHAHIDTAWEWPLREGRRKVARSWSTQLALMETYPDFVFAASQPAQYEWMKDGYPSLFRRIRQRVAEGRWEPVGSMWVEADCNLPSGESLVRQLLYGKRFFMHEFGYETRILWLPDVFGYPGNMPQLIKEAGCDYFLTQKLSWNDTNKPEHQTFWWEGIDGSRVFTHFPPADTYNGDFSAQQVERSVRSFKDASRSNRSLYLFGYGDGGGGPTAEMIESAHAFGIDMGKATDFFDQASAEATDLATVRGELYFELHRGTYTSQSRTKRWNRRADQALREAEMWAVAAGDYPKQAFDRGWKTILLNQFHDILPGSSIDWVYEDAERDLYRVFWEAERLKRTAQRKLVGNGDAVAFFNPTSHNRRELVPSGEGWVRVVAPPCGWGVQETPPPESEVSVADGIIENELLRVTWDDDGRLTSVWDKEAEREVLSGPGNVLELHEDNPRRWDAWDLDIDHRDSAVVINRLPSRSLGRKGLCGTATFIYRFGSSTLVQTIQLDAGSRVLRFETQVDWHERHKILKVAFPVAVTASEATYEVQFGHLQRPTHLDTPKARAMFEVCAQRWADLGDGDYGVAVLNNCKYGHDIHDSVIRLSLLRAPTHPDPNADQGGHQFTYALMPHRGDFREAGVIEAAEDLNEPILLMHTDLPPGTKRSLIEVDTRQVIVDTIKRAEDSDAVIVRIYEAWGRPCHARVKTTLPAKRAWLCDLLERERSEVRVHDGMVDLDLTPFKILTLKLGPE